MPDPRDGIALGIDAGGSKTLGVLVDASGREVARSLGPGANPFSAGRDAARRSLAPIVAALLRRGSVAAACLGSAGVGDPSRRAAAEMDLRALVGDEVALVVCTDAEAALACVDDRPAMVVIAGTGSIVYGERADRSHVRAGGLGAMPGAAPRSASRRCVTRPSRPAGRWRTR